MKKLFTEYKIQATVETLIRLGSYAAVTMIGSKLINKVTEREVANIEEIRDLKTQVLHLQTNNLNEEINKIK